MKKIRLVFLSLISLGLIFPVWADDGSWNSNFSIQGGSVYSETDHPDISLEKELLIFDGEKTVAFFQFRNTTGRQVTVNCGFPVQHVFVTAPGDGLLMVQGWMSESGMKYFETTQVYDPDNEDEADSFWGIDPRGIIINSANNRREFLSFKEAAAEVPFQIEKDGKPVGITDVLLERHAGNDGASLAFHFRHTLSFGPNEVSLVRVEYTQDLRSGHDGVATENYDWNYVIDTGATWKGSIGSLLFIFPASWDASVPGLQQLLRTDSYSVFGARNYVPASGDRFNLSSQWYAWEHQDFMEETFPVMKKLWTARGTTSRPASQPEQNFVTSPAASSFLSDTLTVFHSEAVIEKAGYGPLSAFDGLGETSWCENKPDDGIGEYLECQITRPAWGLAVKNGFTRFPARDWMFQGQDFEKTIRDDSLGLKDYFTMNNRVKELTISTPGGPVLYTLLLTDQRDPEAFPWVSLKPGTYRFTIKSVYPGSKWKDTCLGELTFFTSEITGLEVYWEDPFFKEHLSTIRF